MYKNRPIKNDLFLIFFPFLLVLYVWVAWLTSAGDNWLDLAWAAGFQIFSGDDAYRFFLARSAWVEPGIYTQGFVLPVVLLLDGILVSLFQGSLFWVRVSHGFLSVLALGLLYQATKIMGIRAIVARSGIMILSLMPLFFFVSMSFYGEFWLAWLSMLAIWALTMRRLGTAVFLVSLMPLVRPEGIYFLICLAFLLLQKRNYFYFFLLGVPGFIFFLYLLGGTDGLGALTVWRVELREFLNTIVFSNDPLAFFKGFSFFMLVPALGGLRHIFLYRAWPILLAAFFWIFILLVLIFLKKSDYEARYIAPSLAALVVLWMIFFERYWDWLASYAKHVPLVLFSGVVILLAWQNIRQLTHLNQVFIYYEINGSWPAFKNTNLATAIFGRYTAKALRDEQGIADLACRMAQDQGNRVDTVIVAQTRLYYHLDPQCLRGLTVGYPAAFWPLFQRVLAGQIMAVFPNGDRYSYYTLREPAYGDTRRLLYLESMNDPAYPWRWAEGGYEIYLFAYDAFLKPKVDLKNVVPFDPVKLLGR